MDKEFYWISEESAASIRKFIEPLMEEDQNDIRILNDFDDSFWEINDILEDLDNDK